MGMSKKPKKVVHEPQNGVGEGGVVVQKPVSCGCLADAVQRSS